MVKNPSIAVITTASRAAMRRRPRIPVCSLYPFILVPNLDSLGNIVMRCIGHAASFVYGDKSGHDGSERLG